MPPLTQPVHSPEHFILSENSENESNCEITNYGHEVAEQNDNGVDPAKVL